MDQALARRTGDLIDVGPHWPPLNRREFLHKGLAAGGLLMLSAVLEACAKAVAPVSLDTVSGLIASRKASGARSGVDVFQAGEDYVASLESYLGVGLVRTGNEPIPGGKTTLWLFPTGDPRKKAKPLGPIDAPWHAYTSPEQAGPQGINSATVIFDRPGIWTIVAEVKATGAPLIGTAAVQVKAKGATATKVPGDAAIPSETPTFSDHRGVDPICTRDPMCSMHDLTLADALKGGKPVAFMVGTPKFCSSRTCGPNLDELLAVKQELGDRASFVHAEVYQDDKPDTISRQEGSPTFKQWGMQSEPWLFLIDKNGLIKSRFEGPVTADLIKSGLASLLA